MDFRRIHDHCISFAVSAMLTAAVFSTAPDGLIVAGAGPLGAVHALESAMTGLRGDGWHGTAGMVIPAAITTTQATKPATAPAPEKPPFTEAQIQKLNQRWDMKEYFEVLPDLAKLLGLTRNDEIIRFKRIGGKDDKGVRHTFGRLVNATGYFLARQPNPTEMHAYWVDLDFKVISAAAQASDQSLSILPASDAQKELESEYKDWAEYVDRL